MPWFKWVAVSADHVFQKLKASLCLVLIRRTQRTNPGLGGKTQMSWDTQCFIDKYLIICPLKHRQPVQWCNELHCRRLEDFQHQLNDKWPDSLKVRKESFFKKNKKQHAFIFKKIERKMLLGTESNLFALHALVCSSLAALNIIYHPPADCKSGLWFPFYI